MNKKTLAQCTALMIGFSLLCFTMSGYFNLGKGKSIRESFPPEGGIVGPITVSKKNTVYKINVGQNVGNMEWSSVSGELLDENKNYLFGFGKELWAESGRDAEGYWSERVKDYDMKVTIPEKGTYFLKFESERVPGVTQSINVTVARKKGSALPFFWAGVISLIVGVLMYKSMDGMETE